MCQIVAMEDPSVLRWDAVLLGEHCPLFPRIALPSCSDLKWSKKIAM
jgi:hypothetical protein